MKSAQKNHSSGKPTMVKSGFRETGRDFLKSTGQTITQEVGTMAQDAITSIFGSTSSIARSSDSVRQPGAELRPRMPMTPEYMPMPAPRREQAREIGLFSFQERQESLRVNEQVQQLVTMIRREIFAIDKQNKVLLSESKAISVESMPSKAGIYHINFFEFILRTLRDARAKVTDATYCIGLARGKQKRMGYWGLAKKKGTSFTLSGERTSATQTG